MRTVPNISTSSNCHLHTVEKPFNASVNFLVTGFQKNYSSHEQNPVLCATLDGSPLMTGLQDTRAKKPVAMTDCSQGCFCNQPNT